MTLIAQLQRPLNPARSSERTEGLRRLTFPALGTTCEVQYACERDVTADTFERAVVQWVEVLEAKYSRFRRDSLISRINAAAGREWVAIDPEMEQMLKLCDTLHFLTQGILDPTLLPLMRLWDYKAEHSSIPNDDQVSATLRLIGWPKVHRQPGRIFLPEAGMALDFGGFGKEYAVDVVAQIAVDHGINDVLVDFGHDLRALGKPP